MGALQILQHFPVWISPVQINYDIAERVNRDPDCSLGLNPLDNCLLLWVLHPGLKNQFNIG